MKKSILICTVASCMFGAKINAQVTAAGNGTVVPYRFVGFDGTGAGGAKPLDIRNNWAGMPMNFFTAGTQRMTITPTGLVGIGLNPTNTLLHLQSNAASGGNLFRTDGLGIDINRWQLFTGGNEKFKIELPSNSSNVLLGATANGTLSFLTNNLQRFSLNNGGANATNGFAAFGNNLSGFTAQDRLHLNHTTTSDVKMRFSNANTGVTNLDGANIGIETNGAFRFTQFENRNINFFTTSNITAGTQVERFRIAPNGQVFIGAFDQSENIIDGSTVGGFSQEGARTSLLNVNGPIFSAGLLGASNPVATVLYGYTNPTINSTPNSTNDGFRFKMDRNYFGSSKDALVFEKTEGDDPDLLLFV